MQKRRQIQTFSSVHLNGSLNGTAATKSDPKNGNFAQNGNGNGNDTFTISNNNSATLNEGIAQNNSTNDMDL